MRFPHSAGASQPSAIFGGFVSNKAVVKITINLFNPIAGEDPIKWEKEQDATYTDEKALTGFIIQRVAKILGEGGILDMRSSLEVHMIPLHRIVDINVTAVPQTVSLDTNVSEAAQQEERTKAANRMMHREDPSKPLGKHVN